MMRIGELAAVANVNVQTLRFYERRGLLRKPSRLASGYRTYSSDDVQVVRFIKQSQELGYTLEEIKQLLLLRAKPSGNAIEVRALAESKVRDIEEKIKRLGQMREELRLLLESCNCAETETRCPTLEALDHKVFSVT